MASFQNFGNDVDFEEAWRSCELVMQTLMQKLHEGNFDEKTLGHSLTPLIREATERARALLDLDSYACDFDSALLKSCASTDCISDASFLHHSSSMPFLGTYSETIDRKADLGKLMWTDTRALLKKEEELDRVYKYRFTELELRTKELADAFDSVKGYHMTLKLQDSEMSLQDYGLNEAERELALAKLAYEVDREICEVTSKELETMKELLTLKSAPAAPQLTHSPIASTVDSWCSALMGKSKPKLALTFAIYKWRLRTSKKFSLRSTKAACGSCPSWIERVWMKHRSRLLVAGKDPIMLFNRTSKLVFTRRVKLIVKSALHSFESQASAALVAAFWDWRRNSKLHQTRRDPFKMLLIRHRHSTIYQKAAALRQWRLWSCNLELYLCKLELLEDEEAFQYPSAQVSYSHCKTRQ